MIWFFGLYFGVYFGIFAIVLVLWRFRKQENARQLIDFEAEKPKVSILIAARNEAKTIVRCLKAIERLQYPPEKFEVLIGDDASTDDTFQVVSAFIAGKPNYKLFKIAENLGKARGKANVLAHLCRHAQTGYFFITDADIAVPDNWIEAMLKGLKPGTGIVTGITTVAGRNFLARMQALDWLYTLGMVQVVSDLHLPVTTMGNNMLITREAYEKTGGYEALPFSVTEDIQLFREVLQRGFGFRNLFSKTVLAETLAPENFQTLLHQRKRWLRGTWHLPLYMKGLFLIYAGFYPVLIPFLFFFPLKFGLVLILLKLLAQSVFISISLKRLQRPVQFQDLLWFEWYQPVMAALLLLFSVLPVKVSWKGRKY